MKYSQRVRSRHALEWRRAAVGDWRVAVELSGGGHVIVKAGSAGGSVTLSGRPTEAGEWRFALAAVDCTAELVGEREVSGAERPSLEWVDTWQEGLELLDRYPWVRLYPQAVHPLFVEDVHLAVAKRLAQVRDQRERERAREKWERVFMAAEAVTE